MQPADEVAAGLYAAARALRARHMVAVDIVGGDQATAANVGALNVVGIAYRLPDVMVYLSAQEGLMKIPRSPRYRVTRRPKIMGVQIIGTDSNTREPRLVRQGSSLNKETGNIDVIGLL